MVDWFMQFSKDTFMFNSFIGFLIYWVPLSFCVFGYTVRTAKNYQSDLKQRKDHEKKKAAGEANEKDYRLSWYTPTDTIGDLIGRAIISFIPIANFWAGLFDLAPDMFRGFFEFIGRVFDIPLVPERADTSTRK